MRTLEILRWHFVWWELPLVVCLVVAHRVREGVAHGLRRRVVRRAGGRGARGVALVSDRAKVVVLGVLGAVVFGLGLGALLSTLPGCATPMQQRWTDLDTTREQDQKNASQQLEAICSRDGGPCPAGPVRSIEKTMCLSAASALYDHGQGPVAADAGCQ